MYDVQCWFFSWSPHPYPQPPPFDHGRKENTVQLVPRFYTTLCLFTISIVSLDLTFLFIRFVYSSWERLFRPTPPLAWTLVYFCKWKLQLFLLFFLVFRTYQRNRVFLQSSMHVAFSFLSLFWFSSPMIFLLFLFSLIRSSVCFGLIPSRWVAGKTETSWRQQVQRESLDPAISKTILFAVYICVSAFLPPLPSLFSRRIYSINIEKIRKVRERNVGKYFGALYFQLWVIFARPFVCLFSLSLSLIQFVH